MNERARLRCDYRDVLELFRFANRLAERVIDEYFLEHTESWIFEKN